MPFSFTCRGHRHLLGTHRNTLEFTKESELTTRGDCIIGVSADWDDEALRAFIGKNQGKKIVCDIMVDVYSDSFHFTLTNVFSHRTEIVIRTTNFLSDRTLGVHADKAACAIDRSLIAAMQDPSARMQVTFR